MDSFLTIFNEKILCIRSINVFLFYLNFFNIIQLTTGGGLCAVQYHMSMFTAHVLTGENDMAGVSIASYC